MAEVSKERAFDHQRRVELCKARSKGVPVGHEKCQAAERIDDVDQQEVEEKGGRRREGTEAKGKVFH